MHIYRPIVPLIIHAPDLLDQIFPCKQLSGVAAQFVQQFKFFHGESGCFSVLKDHMVAFAVQGDAPQLNHAGSRDAVSFQQGLDPNGLDYLR